jgi:hypothetical protein
MVKGGPRSTDPTGQPRPEADRWVPWSGWKRKRARSGSGLNFSWAGSVSPTRLGLAHGSAWPAAQQAGSGSGLAGRAGRLSLKSFTGGSSWALLVLGPWRQAASLLLLFVLLTGLLPLLPLLADRSAPRVSLGGIQCGGARIWCGRQVYMRACVRVSWVCEQMHARCSGKIPKGRPRRERDVVAAVRGHDARQGRGGVVAWRRRLRRGVRGKARLGPRQRAAARLGFAVQVRTHARGFWSSRAAAWPCRARGIGIPGPRHDATARGDGVCGGMVAARRAPA